MKYKCNVKEYRQLLNMTQQQLADLLGVSRQTINNLENGKYKPGIILAINIATVMNVSLEKLFCEE
jgi:putative transcriptional regulator